MSKDHYPDSDRIPLRDRSIPEIAVKLQRILGQSIVAYGIRERDPRRIGAFARAEAIPEEETEAVLRDMAEVTETLMAKTTDEDARAIMVGSNTLFGDGEAPIELFHTGQGERVVAQAQQLARL